MSSFASRFKAGSDIAKDLISTYGTAKRNKEIGDIASEKETASYTAEQAAELEALANAKDADGNPYYQLGNSDTGKYTVAPNFQNETGAEPAAYTPSTMAAKGVSYLGKNYDAPLSESQRMGAQQQAMAGVLERGGDIEGAMRYRQQAKQGVLADKQLEQADLQIADARSARDRRVITDGQADTRFANDQVTFARTNAEADRLAKLSQEKAQQEKIVRDVTARFVDGGWKSIPEIYKGYNDGNSATVQEDGKGGAVVSIFDKDGKPAGQQAFRNKVEFATGIIAKMDPTLWLSKIESQAKDKQTQENWDKNYGLDKERLGVSQAQLGLSQSEHKQKRTDAVAQRDAAVEYEVASQNGDEAAMKAARLKIIKASGTLPGTTSAHDDAVTKLANTYIRSGLAKNLAEGLKMATSGKDLSPDRLRADIYGKALAANFGNAAKARETTEEAITYLLQGDDKPSRSASGKAAGAAIPAKGSMVDGFEFLGGNPRDQKSWRKVASGKVN